MSKISKEVIQEELKKQNWKLISETYKNLNSEMEFECGEGHRIFSSWNKIRGKFNCPICNVNPLKKEIVIVPKPRGAKRTLGLDQATHLTGWSIFDDDKLVSFGVFQATKHEEIERDHQIKEWLISMIQNWNPDLIGIEGIQLQVGQMGVTVYETLARLQGILMDCCYEYQVPYQVCHTAKWRAHCKVKGKTRTDKKRSMQFLVKEWYDVSVTDDESDAIGVGKYAAETFNKKVDIESWI